MISLRKGNLLINKPLKRFKMIGFVKGNPRLKSWVYQQVTRI